MVLKAIREFIGFSYRHFKIIVLLNLISILPLYIILLIANHFWFDNIEISKKGFIVIRENDIEQNLWVVVSAMDDESIVISITDDRSQKKRLTAIMKSGREETFVGNKRVAIEIIPAERRDAAEIAFGDSKLLMDIRYIKKNTTLNLKVSKQSLKWKIPYTSAIIVPVFILTSLLLPISITTKNIVNEGSISQRYFPGLSTEILMKSFTLSILYIAILTISLFNITFLKNHDNIVFAIILVINFWIFVFTIVSTIWVFPIASQNPDARVIAIIRHAYRLTLKRILASVFIILIVVLILFAVVIMIGYNALILLFVFPGIAGMLLFLNICYRIVAHKNN